MIGLETEALKGSAFIPFSTLTQEATNKAGAPSAAASALRLNITAAYYRSETECLSALLAQVQRDAAVYQGTQVLATRLANNLRGKAEAVGKKWGVQGLVQAFSLSTQEGVALMCLAEALLRIPDEKTRDALIRDKIAQADWKSYVGKSNSLFVNAATWGLLITGKVLQPVSDDGLRGTLLRLLVKGGEPLIRQAMDLAMRLMGAQFVAGKTIAQALSDAKKQEQLGFTYSYDMLGEAAMTAADAAKYFASYETAIHAIGREAAGKGVYAGPGISIKLSALHPRYSFMQKQRVMNELYPRLKKLAVLACRYDIGLNIDAEEAERLEISLDLLERLCFEPELAKWNGIGFVVQAYQKRAPFVLDFLADLAQRSHHRLMVRLVKGAYWDSEIKRAQQEGLSDYPVYTRKPFTDVSYLVCAQKLLNAPASFFPQFATHNAHTVAAIVQMAGPYQFGQYEFQCLYGMGEALYEDIVTTEFSAPEKGKVGFNRPCRIYAPVGTHETLLAYLVRRLLENGANTSFVNRIADPTISLNELIADPIEFAEEIMAAQKQMTEATLNVAHPKIPLPRDLYGSAAEGGRKNAQGIDLSDGICLSKLALALQQSLNQKWHASAILNKTPTSTKTETPVLNPANHGDKVGCVCEADTAAVGEAVAQARAAFPAWSTFAVRERILILERAAQLLETQEVDFIGLLVREAGKTLSHAIGEVREAIDFLCYYAWQLRQYEIAQSTRSGNEILSSLTLEGVGPVVCISPWNFPLAIFIGQISAALAAGNTVLAKPAEQTPLIAAHAVRLLHQAGVPLAVLQLLPGAGETVGQALVSHPDIRAVMFTGSTAVAKHLQRQLAGRYDERGQPLVLIAETGGQNAMIVDSSALPEQVVTDVLQSAFGSAGQRCSALRVLCLQEEVADTVVEMLQGAMSELRVGCTDRLETDIGPVIDQEAQTQLNRHIELMQARGRKIYQATPASVLLAEESLALQRGTFVLPTLIELESLDELQQEIFGPILHVVRYRREQLDDLLAQIENTGYGLTMGVHTRIHDMVAYVQQRAHVGNLYINRSMVGAVVGVQPFGGEGLSGTGPKAGGPLVLSRLSTSNLNAMVLEALPILLPLEEGNREQVVCWAQQAMRLADLLDSLRYPALARIIKSYWPRNNSPEIHQPCLPRLGQNYLLPGPTGEKNTYSLSPRGQVLCIAQTEADLLLQTALAVMTGNRVLWLDKPANRDLYARLSTALEVQWWSAAIHDGQYTIAATQLASKPQAILFSGSDIELGALTRAVASWSGEIATVLAVAFGDLEQGDFQVPIAWWTPLVYERVCSTNTAAAGGNASLMTIDS